jgi:dihydrofolate reductase
MQKVIVDITMSLDGFITAPNDDKDNGLGDGGEILHDWVFKGTEEDNRVLMETTPRLGSCVLGRRTFDNAIDAWGDNPPFGNSTVFVLTHRPHETMKRGDTTFVFVTDGAESALRQAFEAANGKDVSIFGGEVSQEYLKAGKVDELRIHIANLLLAKGRPLFANIGDAFIHLEKIEVVSTPLATHLIYRVVK